MKNTLRIVKLKQKELFIIELLWTKFWVGYFHLFVIFNFIYMPLLCVIEVGILVHLMKIKNGLAQIKNILKTTAIATFLMLTVA